MSMVIKIFLQCTVFQHFSLLQVQTDIVINLVHRNAHVHVVAKQQVRVNLKKTERSKHCALK